LCALGIVSFDLVILVWSKCGLSDKMWITAVGARSVFEIANNDGSITFWYVQLEDPSLLSRYVASQKRFYQDLPALCHSSRLLELVITDTVNLRPVRQTATSIELVIHIGILCMVGGMASVFLLLRPCRRVYRRRRGRCIECGYNLTGNVSGVCPECGEKI